MKYIAIVLFLMTSQARADFFFIKDGTVYKVPSKYSPEPVPVAKARFLKIKVKDDPKNGSTAYSFEGIKGASGFVPVKKPFTQKLEAGEGCGENPMSWVKKSKVVGNLSNKETAIYLQLPTDVKAVKKLEVKCVPEGQYADGQPHFAFGDNDNSFLVCADDLNYSLLVMKAKSVVEDLVITESCP